ncbi:MAG: acyl-ACP--UDP-N-acetylglucosamine O-acyltransferase [Acidobacteriota bacterium]
MSGLIHPTAIVDADANVASDVEIGPFAVIGSRVSLAAGNKIGAGAQVQGPTSLGEGNRIFPYACVGFEPQDLKFKGGETRLEIGAGNIFREFCTIHRGTEEGGGKTSIGNSNLFMAYSHVAHDCIVGDHTIFSNSATLAGHVVVEDKAVVGAFSAVHQFCRVGRHAYIGGFSVITKDALPWVKTVGQKPLCYGINTIGLQRQGFSEARIQLLQTAMRILLRSGLNTSQAVERLESEFPDNDDVRYLLDFLRGSQRGVITARPGRRGGRGGQAE